MARHQEIGNCLKICCNSHAAIMALKAQCVKSKIVNDTIKTINKMADQGKHITIEWVKAHVGTLGNELADTQAKLGAQNPNKPKTNLIPWK